MAKSSSFGFTNTSVNSNVTFSVTDLKPVTNYALKQDEPDAVVLDNKTAPLDQSESLTYRCREIPKVNTNISIQYPAPVSVGVQYIISLEEVYTTEDPAVNYRVDDPIVAQLTIRHPKSGNISASVIETVIKRLIGSLYESDGTCRISDLMRSALKPTAD